MDLFKKKQTEKAKQTEKKKLKKQTYQKLAAEEFQARTQNTDRAISAYEKNVMRP